MTIDDFLSRVKGQPTVTVEREVLVIGPQLKALLAERRPIPVAELMAHPDQHKELKSFRYAHVVGSGASTDVVEKWQAAHSSHLLPADLKEFLKKVNGIHLWADLSTSRAYFGILPLAEWQDAKDIDWAMMFRIPPIGQLVISYHDNGDNYLVLDTQKPQYLWYDLEDFDRPKSAGRTVPELLDFAWRETAWLDPRRDNAAH